MLYLFKGERTHIRTTFNQNKNKSDRMFKVLLVIGTTKI